MAGSFSSPGAQPVRHMLRAVLAVVAVLPGAASAQDAWTYGSFDNGAWFEAWVTSPDAGVSLNCGGNSPGGQPLPQTDEPMVTANYAMNLTIALPGLRPTTVTGAPRGDLVVAGDTGAAFVLPLAHWDELNGTGWIQSVRYGDPLLELMRGAGALAFDAGGQRHATYGTAGLAPALDSAMAFCDARWAATGVPIPATAVASVQGLRTRGIDVAPTKAATLPPPPSAPEPAPPMATASDTLLARVHAHVAKNCGRLPAGLTANAVRAANIDGDGNTDYVLAWDDVDCGAGSGGSRPFCGASQCLVEVFLSSSWARGEGPEAMYAAAVDVVAGANGLDLVQTAGRLAVCNAPEAPPDCRFYWGWTVSGYGRVK